MSRTDREQVDKRRLLLITLYYYWLDTEAYLKSGHFVSLLKTYDELSETNYFFKIGYKTFLIDLSKTKEELFSAFDAKGARYPINKTLKSGVIVKRAETGAEKMKFYDFYQDFVEDPRRKNKILVLQKHELDTLEIFYAVSSEGEYLGGIGLLPSPDRRYLMYKYAATVHRFSENDLMIWYAIQYAKDAKYSWFDMSWFEPTEDKKSELYRLYQFKKKFGGNLVDFYTYVKLRTPFTLPGLLFKMVLKYFFKGDLHNFTFWLKRLKMFR